MESREFTIHGPGLTEADKREVSEFISGFNIEAQEPVEGEVEKSPEFEQAIIEINKYREEIAADLGLPKPLPMVSAQIHLLPPEVFQKRYPQYSDEAWGNHENMGDGIFIKYDPAVQNMDMVKMFLLHEGIHVDSFRAFYTKNEDQQPIDSLSGETRSGYVSRKPGKERELEHFTALNEAVVQKTTWEKIGSNLPSVPSNPSYTHEIQVLDTIIEKIAEHNREDKKEVWGRIKKGLFTGEMMHLREVAKLYGASSLRVLARLTTENSEATHKALKYFSSTEKEKLTAQSSLTEWSMLNGVSTNFYIAEGATALEKEQIYDAVFREGQVKLLTELRDPNNNEIRLVDKLGLQNLKAELDALRESGNIQTLGQREAEVARLFQQAISEYPYNMETCHIAEILNKKEMNCVGASVLGGALFDEVGIKYQVGHIGNHVLLLTITSDGRIWWQDMQDGLERPEIENEELTTDKIEGTTPSEVAAFANNPTKEGLKFFVKKEYWKDQPLTLTPPNVGLELQELISTGFVLGNNGRNDEAVEILELAKLKSPNDADVHLGLARAYKNEKRYTEAVNACSKALEIDTDNNYLKGVLEELKTLARDTNS